MEAYKLNSGVSIPAIGFGTWQISDGAKTIEAVTNALEAGYRLIDTAKIYGNESGVGDAVKRSKIARQEIFVTTKLWNNELAYELALSAFDASLARLGLEYIDLYLIHWPSTDKRLEAWRALEDIGSSGRAKAVGVSNYGVSHLKEILETSNLVPAVNQIEFNPYVYKAQIETLEFCSSNNIVVEAYSPLARGRRSETLINEIAKVHAKTDTQIMLRWAIQHGTVPIPKSTHKERIVENFDIFDFELSQSEMESLNNLSL